MYRIGRTLSLFAVVAVAAVGLSGCSSSDGGGGGSSSDGGGGGSSLSESQLYGDLAAYEDVAANNPKFGSVTQSSNAVGGITTDSVETMFDGEHLTVTVNNGAGSERFQLNSDDDVYVNLSGTAWMDDQDDDFPPDWSGDGWVLWQEDEDDEDSGVVAFVYTGWESAEIGNYLAGGYWIRYTGEGVEEIGAFSDAGPGSIFAYADAEIPAWTPPSGTAVYLGEAEGAYVYGDKEGVWWSRVILDANFTDETIDGCVGCAAADPTGDDRGVNIYENLNDLKHDRWTEEDLYLALEDAPITAAGTFQGALTVNDLTNDDEYGSGKWGGLFSENAVDSAKPEQVAGTLGGTFDDGEAEGGFVGGFHGFKEEQPAQ